MQTLNGHLVYSPSDLTLFMESPFASWMDHLAVSFPDRLPEKDALDEMMVLLQEKGGAHERGILNEWIALGLRVTDISGLSDRETATLDAMKAGVDVIYQASLSHASFKGYADFLVKVPGDSKFGDYHYEVWDTKLSKSMKPDFTVQLCCYSDMLSHLQGRRPECFVVVLGSQTTESSSEGAKQRLRTDEFFYYYASVRDAFLQTHEAFDPSRRPDPADSKSWGRWEGYAQQLLKQADHPSQVANITRGQIKKLASSGISTMTDLAETQIKSVRGINNSVFERLKAQARIQKDSEGLDKPLYKILIPESGAKQGLALLPAQSPLDVFFDIEGFPLIEGGLEYLWGSTYVDDSGTRQFKDFWAHTQEEEKVAFKQFIDWAYSRWKTDPTMHIYHYANYEIAACRRLMSRYGLCEFEVDELLRNEVFVDLYKIVKSALLIGEPNYSIKNVEHLYREKRQTEVGSGGDSVVAYERWRQQPDGLSWENSKVLKAIRDYNIDDCDSTLELVDWLRARQTENKIAYLGKTDLKESKTEEVTETTELRDRLLNQAAALKVSDPIQAGVAETLAWCLEFHRREAKPVFWRLFDRLGSTDDELYDDPDCLAGCQRTDKAPFKLNKGDKKLAYEYRFDTDQEFKSSDVSTFFVLGEETNNGKSLTVDVTFSPNPLDSGCIFVKSANEPPTRITLVPKEDRDKKPIPSAIESVAAGFEANTLGHSAIMDFLTRAAPRIRGIQPGQPIAPSHDPEIKLSQIISAILNLNDSYLPIQGPPGAGKTYTAKHVIAALVKQGKRVGISSNSHKAINHLLVGTTGYCREQGIDAFFGCSKDTGEDIHRLEIEVLKNDAITENTNQPCVIGTTAWGFARPELEKQFDYLFVDEAGQVSVANLIAMSRAAKNIVLLGDQMQLGQPSQANHPGESGLSTLDYLLHHTPTISDDKGVFLETTYRMHRAVNHFISSVFYEGKLHEHANNNRQKIEVPAGYAGVLNKEAGVFFIPVEHEGNTQASDEEVEAIKAAVRELIGRTFTDKKGETRPITLDDMLFVAPYNLQVGRLRRALGEAAKVGSVDKFQGQEAPIVFFSLCASDPQESPRGLDFLFDKNRINVAISRAQVLAIVVGNPAGKNCRASNLEQQSKLNVVCQLLTQ